MQRNLELPVISYNELESTFKTFDALKKYGAFILKDVPHLSSSTLALTNEFDNFKQQSNTVINTFTAGSHFIDFAGFHPQSQYWAGRRFSECYSFIGDKNCEIQQALPTENFRQSTRNFLKTAHIVTDKILLNIGNTLKISDSLMPYFHGYKTLGIIDNYLPPTQERITVLQSSGKLVKIGDRLEAFKPHCDLNAITCITYKNNDCRGLEFEFKNELGDLSYTPITLPKDEQLTPLVLLGAPMEALTNKILKAPKHRVVLEPTGENEIFSRKLISAFTLFGSDKEVKSLVDDKSNILQSTYTLNGQFI